MLYTGYELFVDMAGMPAKYRHLRTRLRIEQTRLLTWGEKIGLIEELLDEPSRTLSMNRNLILDVLVEIQTTFKSVVKVTTVFDQAGPQQEQEQVLATSGSSSSSSTTRAQISILRRTLEHLERPSKLIARLEWAMIKQEKFEELIVRLIAYNDRIESFLDRSTLEELRISQEHSNLLLLQVTEQLSQLKVLVDAVQLDAGNGTLRSAPATGQRLSRSSTLHEIENSSNLSPSSSPFTDLVKFKLQQKAMDSQMEDLQMLLSLSLLFPNGVSDTEHRSRTKLYGKSLWVEWSDPVPECPGIQDVGQIFEDRVAKLASILSSPEKPAAFRGPKCLGYLRQEDDSVGLRFGLVYDASSAITGARAEGEVEGEGEGPPQREAQIQSLRDLLHDRRKPSLTKRLSLALKLAESLMYLHAVNWLHKGLRSDSVMFCTPAPTPGPLQDDKTQSHSRTEGQDILLENPIVSGFEFSRPDLSKEVTVKYARTRLEHDLYRHPDLLRYSDLRSQKSHDIYSLGLVLLEIAFWQPVEQLAHIGIDIGSNTNVTGNGNGKGAPGTGASAIVSIRDTFIYSPFRDYPSLKEAAAAEMGDDFADAVWRCLRGGEDIGIPHKADQADPNVGARIQAAFHEEVVLRLHSGRL